jgi:hypothetical protein
MSMGLPPRASSNTVRLTGPRMRGF